MVQRDAELDTRALLVLSQDVADLQEISERLAVQIAAMESRHGVTRFPKLYEKPLEALAAIGWPGKLALYVVLCASAAGAGIWTWERTRARPEPPHKNISVELVKTVIAPGEPLQIRFFSHRIRLCKADLERVWLNAAGNTIHIQRVAGIGQAVTEHPVMRTITVPQPIGLEPGRYTYRSTIYTDCGPGDAHAEATPELSFEVR